MELFDIVSLPPSEYFDLSYYDRAALETMFDKKQKEIKKKANK